MRNLNIGRAMVSPPMTEDVRSVATRLVRDMRQFPLTIAISAAGISLPLHVVDPAVLADWASRLEALLADHAQQIAQQETEIAALTAKERREFAWAEEYMAKARSLELELEQSRQQARD